MESGFNHLYLNSLVDEIPVDFRYLAENKKPIYLEVEAPGVHLCGILNLTHISEFEDKPVNLRCYSGIFTFIVEGAPGQMTLLLVIDMDTGEGEIMQL